jgi:5-methylcytosine-specific restriction enzyme A
LLVSLRPTARPLRVILGDADFEKLQDMWAEDGKRRRWSVAFPIVESYDIPTRPFAHDVFTPDAMRRVFAHPSATLRPLNDNERAEIAKLPITARNTTNAWIGIEDEITNAERSDINKEIMRNIDADLKRNAMEGMTAEQKRGVRIRAAWLAQKFVIRRQTSSTLTCDQCGFDPINRVKGTPVRARSLLDVHHRSPLEEGVRVTTLADFILLCPTCHRFEHRMIQASRHIRGAAAASSK